jgi:hypothetical protein
MRSVATSTARFTENNAPVLLAASLLEGVYRAVPWQRICAQQYTGECLNTKSASN